MAFRGVLGLIVAFAALQHTTTTAATCSNPDTRSCRLLELNYPKWQQAAAAGQPECSWPGVTCSNSSEQVISGISLAGQGIEGTLPNWGGFQGIRLVTLDLSNNKLSGNLPTDWGFLQSPMKNVNLSNNLLSGTLPDAWGWGVINDLERMDLSSNRLTGTLPAQWAAVNFTELYLNNNNLTGGLPPYWGSYNTGPLSISEMQGSLTVLNLSNNGLSGGLPADWQHLRKLSSMDVGNQAGSGFTGKMPDTWRQLCINHNLKSLVWAVADPSESLVVPVGINNLDFTLGWRVGLSQDWRANGCVYPYAKEFILALLVGIPGIVIIICSLGLLVRRRYLAQAKAGNDSSTAEMQPGNAGLEKSNSFKALYGWVGNTVGNHGRVVYGIAKLVLVFVDAVSDCLTVQQVWGSWVSWVLLACVFVPDIITSVCLTICSSFACVATLKSQHLADAKSSALAPGSKALSKTLTMSSFVNNNPRALGSDDTGTVAAIRKWLAAAVPHIEHCLICVACHSSNPAWPFLSAVILWPLCLLVTPYLLLLGCLTPPNEQAVKSIRQSCKLVHPHHIAVLYDRFAGAIEAPVSAGLLVMLLVIGVRPSNSYVVTNPIFLYISLCFSVVHFLVLVWEIVMVAAKSRGLGQFVKAFYEPFIVATAPQDLGNMQTTSRLPGAIKDVQLAAEGDRSLPDLRVQIGPTVDNI